MEAVAIEIIAAFLLNAAAVLDAFSNDQLQATEKHQLVQSAQYQGEQIVTMASKVQRVLIQQLVERITVNANGVALSLRQAALRSMLLSSNDRLSPHYKFSPEIILTSPARLARCGLEMRLIVPAQASREFSSQPSPSLIKALARGRYWYEQLISGKKISVADLAVQAGVNDRYASRILRSALLAPDIVETIINGREPAGLTLDKLLADLPLSWERQRQAFGL